MKLSSRDIPFDKILSYSFHPLGILTWFVLVCGSILFFDRPITLFFSSFSSWYVIRFFQSLTMLGEGKFFLFVFSILFLILYFGTKRQDIARKVGFLWLCLAFSYTICFILKTLLGRARPMLFLNDHIYGFFGLSFDHLYRSFPSGHTTAIMSLMLGLSILYPRRTWVFLLIGGLVAFSRLVLLQHFLSDILFATYLVILEIALLKRVLFQRVVYGKTQ